MGIGLNGRPAPKLGHEKRVLDKKEAEWARTTGQQKNLEIIRL